MTRTFALLPADLTSLLRAAGVDDPQVPVAHACATHRRPAAILVAQHLGTTKVVASEGSCSFCEHGVPSGDQLKARAMVLFSQTCASKAATLED